MLLHSVLGCSCCGTSFQATFYEFLGRCQPCSPLGWSRCFLPFQKRAAVHVSSYSFCFRHQMHHSHWMCDHCSSFFKMWGADHLLGSLATKQRQLLPPRSCLWVSSAASGKGSGPRIVEVSQQRACFVKSNSLSCWPSKQTATAGSLGSDKLQLQKRLLRTYSAPAANSKHWLVDEALGCWEWRRVSSSPPEISFGTYLSSEAWMIAWKKRCCWLLGGFSARASDRRFAWVVRGCRGFCLSDRIFLWPSSAL